MAEAVCARQDRRHRLGCRRYIHLALDDDELVDHTPVLATAAILDLLLQGVQISRLV
jgi:hypothetical protein